MSGRNPIYQDEARTLQNSLELELSELRALHESYADSLKEAFSPGVVQLLRKLSSEDCFFQFPPPDDLQSVYPSSSTTYSSSTTDLSSEMSTPDIWNTTRTMFKFICDEFMPAPKEQQMGKFHKFLEQVKGTASRIRLPGGSSLSPDQNATLKQCVAAVKTMKEVISSKFASLQKYVEMRMDHQTHPAANIDSSNLAPKLTQVHVSTPSSVIHQCPTSSSNIECSNLGPKLTQVHVSNPSSVIHQCPTSSSNIDFGPKRTDASGLNLCPASVIHQCPGVENQAGQTSGDTHQTVPGRTETIFRFCGPRNPNVARVIEENPHTSHFEGDHQVRPSEQGVTDHSSPQPVLETNQGDRSASSSPRKRPPLKRQSHVIEED